MPGYRIWMAAYGRTNAVSHQPNSILPTWYGKYLYMLFSVSISIYPKVSTKVGFDHSERLAQQISWGIGEPDKDETEKLGAIQGSHVGLSNVFCFQCSVEECSLTICFDVCPLLMQAFSCHKTHTMDLSQADQYSPEPSRLSIFKSLVLSEGRGLLSTWKKSQSRDPRRRWQELLWKLNL